MYRRTACGVLCVALGLSGVSSLIWYGADTRAAPKVVDVAPLPPRQIAPATEVTPEKPEKVVVEQPVVVNQPPGVSVADDRPTISGTIMGVGKLRRMSLLVDGQGHVFTVAPTATITLNGNPALLTDLAAGMRGRVRVQENEPDRVIEIAAFQRVGCGVSVGAARAAPIAYLGVRLDASDVGPAGVQILDVYESSPADLANFYIGDRIVAIDNVTMEDSKQILATIRGHQPDDRLRVEVLRDGESTVIPVTLAQRRTRIASYEGLGCSCGCAYRELMGGTPATNDAFAERQRELLAQNQQMEGMLRQLQQEVRELRAEVMRAARR